MNNLNRKKNSKVIKMNKDFKSQNFIYIKKIKVIFIVVILILVFLLGRIACLQFINGNYLKELAYQQQAINQIISPKRGSIYDSTGQVLASSVSVDTITINPEKIKDSSNDKEKTQILKEKVAKAFSDIFQIDYNETLKKVNSNAQVETIVRKVEQDKIEELRNWMEKNKISVGINIDEDSKRYYPFGTLLSQVLGSCGSDNQGLAGIEYTWKNSKFKKC